MPAMDDRLERERQYPHIPRSQQEEKKVTTTLREYPCKRISRERELTTETTGRVATARSPTLSQNIPWAQHGG